MPGFKFGTNTPTVNWADARGTGGTVESTAMSQVRKNICITLKSYKSFHSLIPVNYINRKIVVGQVKVIYIRNLPEGATQEQVMKLFEPHGEISKVVLPPSRPGQPKRDFGFIHFVDRSGAMKAIDKAHKYILGGKTRNVESVGYFV